MWIGLNTANSPMHIGMQIWPSPIWELTTMSFLPMWV
jgi:hypothetical protein